MRFGLLLLLCPLLALAGPEDDWKRLLELDAGPGKQPASAAEARSFSLAHLDKQENALRSFMNAHRQDERMFDARLRLARLLGLRADLKEEPEPAEVEKLLAEAEASIQTLDQRSDLDFARLNRTLRRWQGKRPTPAERSEALEVVRKFQKAHPDDRRTASVLYEISTFFEHDPAIKGPLLRDAGAIASEPMTKAQIADDVKRLALLGKPLPLRFTDQNGIKQDAVDWRGKVVVVLFFAASSEPAKEAFVEIQKTVSNFGDDVRFVGVSLDGKSVLLQKFLRERKSTIPILWDGKGWSSPLIEALGLNAVPAAWLLDKKGVLRSLDILDDPAGAIRKFR